jgi:hypothetical protein
LGGQVETCRPDWLRSMPDNIELDCLSPDLAQRVLGMLGELVIF